MATALRRTAPAIVSAGGIVVVAMLVRAIDDYNATRWMGPVLAIGMAVTVLAGVTLLPAVLAALGRVPQPRAASTLWPRIGRFVEKRPAVITVTVLALLVAGALGNLADRVRDGSVIDYVDPALWPAFNLADAAIVIGILGLLYVVEGPRQ